MSLVSPGIQISINDQSQYVNASVGTVPLVVFATAQDKTYNGSAATGTSKANAGQLQSFTSQRDLVTAMGTPLFQLSAAGTPLHGNELNEYGLMAAYSALGLGNQLYAIRADIDLAQLQGTAIRPVANPADQTYWLDTVNTEFGAYELNAQTGTFGHIAPMIITDTTQVLDDNSFSYSVPTPITAVGTPGSYAFVMTDINGATPSAIRMFYKATANSVAGLTNTWVQVGSSKWQQSRVAVQGTIANPTLTVGASIQFANYPAITTTGTTVVSVAAQINSAAIPGLYAAVTANGLLNLFITSAAKSGGSSASTDGKIIVTSGLTTCGIPSMTYYSPYFFYGTYAQAPAGGWFSTDTQPRPTGSVWIKTTSTGTGYSPVLKEFSATLNAWQALNAPLYNYYADAIYALDPVGGGANIAAGTIITTIGADDTTSNGIRFAKQAPSGVSIGSGGQIQSATPFTAGNTLLISASAPGQSGLIQYTVTLSGTSASSFVSDVLAANIPFVSAQFNASVGMYGSITIIHTSGGVIRLANGTGTPLTAAQFVSGMGSNLLINSVLGYVTITNWVPITKTIAYQAASPYTAPVADTLWYYSNPADIDILINNNGWKGYQNVSADVRGFNLANTDPLGVIISATTPPATQTDGTALVAGDLWLDSGDLIAFPSLYRFNGSVWSAIDNTDHISSNGIVFADARWDTTGTTDIIEGAFPSITSLLSSNYIDQDAPDYRLYPRGTLLFNMRRSGYSIKQYTPAYFTNVNFPSAGLIPGSAGTLPTVQATWKTVSGLDSNGVMHGGAKAQRALVVAAMSAAVDGNLTAREDVYSFSLLCAPGYPEVLANLTTLNNDRANTGFIIGDTPLTLAPNAVAITNWISNSDGTGLPSASASDPYTAIYYPAGLTNDLAGNVIAVPASHAALRTFMYSDNVSYPWFAPAGVNRGLVSNLSDIGYVNAQTGSFIHNGIGQGVRDALYTLQLNPITQIPGVGIVIWGQETRAGGTTSRNRVNVVRLENYLRTIFKTISNGYLFEPNDATTRKSISAVVESALNDVVSKRGMYSYLVVCDTSNNTSSAIANNQLYIDVAIEPTRATEFIYIPIAFYNPGVIATLNTTSS